MSCNGYRIEMVTMILVEHNLLPGSIINTIMAIDNIYTIATNVTSEKILHINSAEKILIYRGLLFIA
jgi:hypothetical protein